MTVRIEVVAHGPLRRWGDGCVLEFDGAPTAAEVLDRYFGGRPEAAGLRMVTRLARGVEYVAGETRLADGDEVHVIPPVSGG